MNYIVISPSFPENFIEFSVSLKKEGINVLGIGDSPYDSLPYKLKEALTEYYRVDSMDNYGSVLRAVAFFTFKYGKIDRLESHNEHWLEMDAALRTDFNIFGFKSVDMKRLKGKDAMKELFRKAHVPYIRGRIVRTWEEAVELIGETGYPVVAKPDSGVGAADTYKIKNEEDLERFFRIKPNVDYIMEEFIEGKIVTFDGLTDTEGDIVFINSFYFENAIMDLVNDGMDNIYYSVRDIPSDIVDYGTRVIKAAGLKERFFHFEFFRKPDGSLVSLELNIRPPGGQSTDIFDYEYDFSVYDIYAKIVREGTYHNQNPIMYHVAYAGLKNHTPRIHTKEECVNYLGSRLIEMKDTHRAFSKVLGDYYYIFRCEEKKDLLDALKYVSE